MNPVAAMKMKNQVSLPSASEVVKPNKTSHIRSFSPIPYVKKAWDAIHRNKSSSKAPSPDKQEDSLPSVAQEQLLLVYLPLEDLNLPFAASSCLVILEKLKITSLARLNSTVVCLEMFKMCSPWETNSEFTIFKSSMGDGFMGQDIWFQNTAGATKHQVVALRVSANQSAIKRCRMYAFQDTLYAYSNR
ncbi:hypothetical protein LR48_Vigan06g153200 [Vigna angularis]|uniref:Pectinesterase catalytic domain-containing protein n=1 Tax=Phaseolus angularis TaxID=3914 RepID=A0A0L9UU19_PHAAN|nr:hypothetical protein LR48_Vigan06g153200 [Vigna angularis]